MAFMHFDSTTSVGARIDHATTMTVGKYTIGGVSYPYGPTFPIYVASSSFGYDNGPDFNAFPNFGAVAQPTFTDASNQTRSIVTLYWFGPESGMGLGYFINFVITGTDVPDFDTTYKGLFINGNYIARSARTNYYADSAAGASGPYGGSIGAGHTAWAFGASYPNYFGAEGGMIPIIIDIV